MMKRILEKIAAIAKRLGRGLIADPGLKIVALLFAIILWNSAMTEANPMTRVTLENIPVSFRGMDALNTRGYAIGGDPDSYLPDAKVTVELPRNEYQLLTRGDITLYADLTSINEEGEHELRISYLTARGTVQSVNPAVIMAVPIERIGKKAIPVKVELTGKANPDYWYGDVHVTPNIVQITGPMTTVNSVEFARILLDVTDVTETVYQSGTFTLLDGNGNKVDSVALAFSTPNPIISMQVLPKKTLPINIDLATSGEVDADYKLVSITSFPAEVTLAGEQSLLDSMQSVPLEPLDISGLTQDKVFTAQLRLPAGVSLVNDVPVSVTVRLEPKLDTVLLEDAQVKVIGLKSGLRVRANLPRVSVQVTCPVFKARDLRLSQIQLYVDAAGLEAGTYTLGVKCDVDSDVQATSALPLPDTVTIQIE